MTRANIKGRSGGSRHGSRSSGRATGGNGGVVGGGLLLERRRGGQGRGSQGVAVAGSLAQRIVAGIKVLAILELLVKKVGSGREFTVHAFQACVGSKI